MAESVREVMIRTSESIRWRWSDSTSMEVVRVDCDEIAVDGSVMVEVKVTTVKEVMELWERVTRLEEQVR